MYYGLAQTRPFIYTSDSSTNKERFLIDESELPIDLTLPFGDANTVFISNGTVNVLRPIVMSGILVILN